MLQVLHAAGVENPRALVLVYTARARLVNATRELREAYPGVPIYARALDARHAAELMAAGATDVVTANTEAGTAMGSRLLNSFGAKDNALQVLTQALRKQVSELPACPAMELLLHRRFGVMLDVGIPAG